MKPEEAVQKIKKFYRDNNKHGYFDTLEKIVQQTDISWRMAKLIRDIATGDERK